MSKPEGQNKRFRFSAEKLAALPTPTDGPAVYYDTDVPPLCFRIQPTGKTKFFVLKKVAGKTYRRTLQSTKLDAARKHAHKLLSDVLNWLDGDRKDPCPMVRPLDDDKLTFSAAFEMYLKSPRPRVTNKEKAEKRSRYLFDHCLTPISGRDVNELTPIFIGANHEKLEKKYGPIMANRAHEIIRATFNHLITKELWTNVNPAKGATRAPKRERDIILEANERKPFLDALNAETNRDFAEWVALLLVTGVRTSNLYSAEWTELKLARAVWNIPAEKSKSGKPMAIPLTKQAVELFRMREKRLEKRRKEGCPWVFPSKAGSKSGHVEDYKNQFKRLKERAGLTNFTRHDLRRTFVAGMIMAGVPMPVASTAAGHSNLDSMKPYARFYKEGVGQAVEAGQLEMERLMDAAEAEKKLLSA
jgi:integrase